MEGSNHFNTTFSALPTTIFEVMSRLAAEHQSINLGQGFPDTELEGPSTLKDIVSKSMMAGPNQYPPMMGVPDLRQAVAAHSERYTDIKVDWSTETLITLGATEALASAFLGLLNPGDEVIIFEPVYDSYIPMIRRAGATVVKLQLKPPHWSFDPAELVAAISTKTKLVVVNTPHNPTGKVFSVEELQLIAGLAQRYDAYVLLDEVYEHLVFPTSKHITLRQLPDMLDRSFRIGSAGKTFSFTDFKIGWVTGCAPIVTAIAKAHQFLTFTVNSSLQKAVAYGLNNESNFYLGLGALLEGKRLRLAERLERIGFTILPAQGTYFLVADFQPLLAVLGVEENDVEVRKFHLDFVS